MRVSEKNGPKLLVFIVNSLSGVWKPVQVSVARYCRVAYKPILAAREDRDGERF